MSYLEPARDPAAPGTAAFGFEFTRSDKGWRWIAYDGLGRIAAEGLAPSKAAAAACVIRELART